jgi:Zn finger protein HypA/HybF involved in hydrogenase expression
MSLIKDGPMRFTSIELRCVECGAFWSAPSVVFKGDTGWEYDHLAHGACELCGSKTVEVTSDGVGALVDATEGDDV